MTHADLPGVQVGGSKFQLGPFGLALLVVALLLAGCDISETGDMVPRVSMVTATASSAALEDSANLTGQPAGELRTPVSAPDGAMTAPLKRSAAGDPIPRVHLAELPVEAMITIELILAGGPFPVERDGATFHNFEQRLPAAGDGAYREYTVVTPGSDDRGARRIVTDIDRTEFHYTDDHYESFSEIIIP